MVEAGQPAQVVSTPLLVSQHPHPIHRFTAAAVFGEIAKGTFDPMKCLGQQFSVACDRNHRKFMNTFEQVVNNLRRELSSPFATSNIQP